MMKNHYLPERQRDRINAEFERDPLYRRLRSLALKVESLSGKFSLSPEDLYFFALKTLDTLWEHTQDEEMDELEYCRDLWLELRGRFAEKIDCGENDHALAATLTVCTTCNLLNIMKRSRYWRVINLLMRSTRKNDPEQREQIEYIIEDVLYSDNAFIELKVWMEQYYISDVILSDKIADMITETSNKEIPNANNSINYNMIINIQGDNNGVLAENISGGTFEFNGNSEAVNIPRMPAQRYADDFGHLFYEFVMNNKLVDANTQEDVFLFYMNMSNTVPGQLQQVKWIGTKQNLRETMHLLYAKKIAENQLKMADVEKLIPCCFNDRNGERMTLAKNKPEPSLITDAINHFFIDHELSIL